MIVQIERDTKDKDKIHIYSHYKNNRQWHLATLLIEDLEELFFDIDNLTDRLYEQGSLWVSYNPKIEE